MSKIIDFVARSLDLIDLAKDFTDEKFDDPEYMDRAHGFLQELKTIEAQLPFEPYSAEPGSDFQIMRHNKSFRDCISTKFEVTQDGANIAIIDEAFEIDCPAFFDDVNNRKDDSLHALASDPSVMEFISREAPELFDRLEMYAEESEGQPSQYFPDADEIASSQVDQIEQGRRPEIPGVSILPRDFQKAVLTAAVSGVQQQRQQMSAYFETVFTARETAATRKAGLTT